MATPADHASMANQRVKRAVSRILLVQFVLAALVALVAWYRSDAWAALSAGVGGGINIVTTAYFASRVFSVQPGAAAKRMMRAFYVGEVIKIILTAALFSAALLWWGLSPLPLFVAYTVTMLAFWLALPLTL